jgi:hypothetical protein
MADTLHLTVTRADGSSVAITGDLVNSTATEIPAPTTVVTLPPQAPGAPVIPATAKRYDMMSLPDAKWATKHDPGTGTGLTSGSTTYPFNLAGAKVRQFLVNLAGKGGQIFYADVMTPDTGLLNVCYESVLESPDFTNFQNIEQDFNWVGAAKAGTKTGDVTIIGQQLASGSGTAEITKVTPTTDPTTKKVSYACHWVPTTAKAKPVLFTPNVQHTIRWYAQHDGKGNVTYIGVEIDGIYQKIGVTMACFDPLAWAADLFQMQLQLDGASGSAVSSVLYAHALNAYIGNFGW